jgi:hypothetical protein
MEAIIVTMNITSLTLRVRLLTCFPRAQYRVGVRAKFFQSLRQLLPYRLADRVNAWFQGEVPWL